MRAHSTEGLLVLCVKHVLLQPFEQGLSATTRVQISGSAVGAKVLQQQRLQHVAQLCRAHTCKQLKGFDANRRDFDSAEHFSSQRATADNSGRHVAKGRNANTGVDTSKRGWMI